VVADAVAWLCRSPRRLAVTVGGAILLIFIGGSIISGNGGSPTAGNSPSPTPSSVKAAQVPDSQPYVDTAVRFVDAWSTRKKGESEADWQDRVGRLSTPELAAALKQTDLEQLPGSPPAGAPKVRYVAEDSGLVAVPLEDGSTVLVTVVAASRSTWQVSDIQPDEGDFGDAP
jgi:hypothetical protein